MGLPGKTAKIVVVDKEKAELQEEALRAPGEGEVLVRSTWTLISTGTETIVYGKRFDPGTHWDQWIKYPTSIGYCQTGVVEAVGSGVKILKPGDRVAGRVGHRHYHVLPESQFLPIPDGVSDRDAAWHSLAAIVQGGVRRAAHEMGDDVAIVGLGPLGQLAVQFVRVMGAREIIAIDPVPGRLEMAKAHGATQTLTMDVDAAIAEVAKITSERLCDAVYDMTGNSKVFAAAQQMLRRFGKLVLIGDTGSPAGQHLTPALIVKSLQIIASHANNTPPGDTDWSHWTRDNMTALYFRYLKEGRMRVSDLNTHAFSPTEAQTAYQKLLYDRAGTMGCHFDWTRM